MRKEETKIKDGVASPCKLLTLQLTVLTWFTLFTQLHIFPLFLLYGQIAITPNGRWLLTLKVLSFKVIYQQEHIEDIVEQMSDYDHI